MYLENLQINGFKSFARKTKFLFNDGITAIVGPNGCGKSNTVDALRWVLGEQKAGTIRSEKMENVIFNGTKNAKPLGMAEVSLTIKNTKNILPVQYSEVVITRRLFRSLESQYLLNNTPCRLKDIQDLFMDTGMGPNAYSIIELSMIETILNGKAEERRRIVEEAAGITKYKLRRKAALRKLEATAGDLLRVNDIISEVEKVVASLNRQVKKAQRYQEFKTQLRDLEVMLATYQFSKIRFELEPLSLKLNETLDSRVSLTTKFDEKESEIEEARRKLLDLERNLSEEQQALNTISTRIQKQEEDILIGRERRKALEDAKVKLVRDKEELKVRIEKTEREVSAARESLQAMFETIQVAETDFQEKNAALNKIETKIQEKNEHMKAAEHQRLQAVEGLTESKKNEERVKTQLENISERISTLSSELEENKLLAKVRQEKIDTTLDKKTEAEGEVARIKENLNAVLEQVSHLLKSKEVSKEKLLNRKAEIQRFQDRISMLKKFIESYEDHPEGVQHLLLEGHLSGENKGTLAENLTVKERYRRALETAIGDASVSLIVEGTEQALNCIEILKSENKGSVGFFPMDWASSKKNKRNSKIDVKEAKGIIDWAYNLVQCDSEFLPIVKSLLEDYIVVEDFKTAQDQAKQFEDEHLSFITLNGELVSTWGLIKGGANQGSDSGIIGRKVLVEELEQQLDDAYTKLDEDEAERQKIENNYQEKFRQEQELTHRLKRENEGLNELEKKYAQLEFEARKDSEQRERLQNDYKSQMETQDEFTRKFKKISPSLSGLVDDKLKYDSQLKKTSDELIVLEEEVKESRNIAQDSRMELVELKGQERHLQESISKLIEFNKDLKEQSIRTDDEIENSTNEYTDIEKRITGNKSAIQVDLDAHEALQKKVHGIEQKYLEDKEVLQAKEKFVRELRDERDVVSETLHTMELRVSELKMRGEKIVDRIQDEYGQRIRKAPIEEEVDIEANAKEITRIKERLDSMGPVNLLALKEFEKEKERFDFLVTQRDDLVEAESNLNETIRVINKTAKEQFQSIFVKIQENFTKVFNGFFPHGQASIKLDDGVDQLEADIVIEADPKGKRSTALTLLSGGEKTLTAISLLFAIYLVKPSPFCILDEVDAPLDDANIGRFVTAIREFSKETQFIVITHNKLTMRASDCLYGVTMEDEGVSKVVSVNFKDMEGLAAA